MQTTTQHDIVGAMKILLSQTDEKFADRVHKFGAVHVDKQKRQGSGPLRPLTASSWQICAQAFCHKLIWGNML